MELSPVLSDDQVRNEMERPERKPHEEFAFHNKYTGEDPPPSE
jgi:hypothetical protein